jgi:hypothetical protein
MPQLTSCTTWECVNSFSNWIAALGTVFISAIALWLALKDRMINMRATFDTVVTNGINPLVLDRHGFMLSFTNIGPRPITVTGHTWRLPFVKGQLFFMPQMERETAHLNSRLPVEITDGKEGHLFYKENFFSELEQPEIALFHPKPIVAFCRIWFFRIRIGTSVGKRVRVRVMRTARRRLWALYLAHNNSLRPEPLRGSA